MRKSQANRAVIAARASASTPNTGRCGMSLGPLTVVKPGGYAARKGKRPGADKGQKGWDRSPYYATSATVDARWSA